MYARGDEVANELYTLIGGQTTDSPEQLRKTYFKTLRQHPPETDPERHQEIRHAWSILGDPEERRRYDALQQEGGTEAAQWLARGTAALGSKDWPEAIRSFKTALALSPEHLPSRGLLARALLLSGDFAAAMPHYDTLCQTEPQNMGYQMERGFAILHHLIRHTENQPKRMNGPQKALIPICEQSFMAVVTSYPQDPTGYMGMARLTFFLEDWPTAQHWAHQVIALVPDSGFEAKDALFLLIEIHIASRQPTEQLLPHVEALLQRIPPHPELQNHIAQQLGRLASVVMRARGWAATQILAREALKLVKEDKTLSALLATSTKLTHMEQELEQVSTDPMLIEPVRALGAWAFLAYTEGLDEKQGKELFIKATHGLQATQRPIIALKALEHLKSQYPLIWSSQQSILEDIRVQIAAQREVPPPSPPKPLASAKNNQNFGTYMMIIFSIASLIRLISYFFSN